MPPCCRTIPAFEHALLVRICQLLVTQLQILLDPACDMATQQAELKVVLRVMRTVLRNFYRQLRTKCGVFIEALLAGGMRGLCASHPSSRDQHCRTLFTQADAVAWWPPAQAPSCSPTLSADPMVCWWSCRPWVPCCRHQVQLQPLAAGQCHAGHAAALHRRPPHPFPLCHL